MTLYREAESDNATRSGFEKGSVEMMVVPVEPCEHGAIKRHPVYADDAVEADDGFEWSVFEKWCEGAALKEGT